MRSRLEAFIPIVLLSILVQLIALIAAFRVVGYAVSDPLYMVAICSGMASADNDAQTTPAQPRVPHDICYAVCGVGLGRTVAVNPPPLVSAILLFSSNGLMAYHRSGVVAS
jgi:hypothetical protein